MKAQLLVELETGQVIAVATDKGKIHDFKLLKRSRLPFVRILRKRRCGVIMVVNRDSYFYRKRSFPVCEKKA